MNNKDNYDKSVSKGTHEFDVSYKVVEESKVYTWTRLYIREEVDIEKGDVIKITHTPTKEVIKLEFSSYEKKGVTKDSDGNIVTNYVSEDDTKVLCLLVDMGFINDSDNGIPFLRSLFKGSKYYDHHILRLIDFKFEVEGKDINLDCYSFKF